MNIIVLVIASSLLGILVGLKLAKDKVIPVAFIALILSIVALYLSSNYAYNLINEAVNLLFGKGLSLDIKIKSSVIIFVSLVNIFISIILLLRRVIVEVNSFKNKTISFNINDILYYLLMILFVAQLIVGIGLFINILSIAIGGSTIIEIARIIEKFKTTLSISIAINLILLIEFIINKKRIDILDK